MSFKTLLLATAISCAVISQALATCVFSLNWSDEYTCNLENVVSRHSSDSVDLSGTHLGGRTNADVLHVTTGVSSTIEEIPSIIFDTFPNLQTLSTSRNLLRLNLENCGTNMEQLWLTGNQLLFELNAGAVRGCRSLLVMLLMYSSIQSIDDNAFDNTPHLAVLQLNNNFLSTIRGWLRGLSSLQALHLENNQITSIQSGAFVGSGVSNVMLNNNRLTRIESGTFVDMPNLVLLSIQNNLIANIDAGAFGNVPLLNSIDLLGNQLTILHAIFATPLPSLGRIRFESNRINAVARNFFDATPLAQFVSFVGNVCVDQEFNVVTSIEADVLPGMQLCFNNYV